MEEKQIPIKPADSKVLVSRCELLLRCCHCGLGAGGAQSPVRSTDHQCGEKELLYPHRMTWGDLRAKMLVVPGRVLIKVL